MLSATPSSNPYGRQQLIQDAKGHMGNKIYSINANGGRGGMTRANSAYIKGGIDHRLDPTIDRNNQQYRTFQAQVAANSAASGREVIGRTVPSAYMTRTDPRPGSMNYQRREQEFGRSAARDVAYNSLTRQGSAASSASFLNYLPLQQQQSLSMHHNRLMMANTNAIRLCDLGTLGAPGVQVTCPASLMARAQNAGVTARMDPFTRTLDIGQGGDMHPVSMLQSPQSFNRQSLNALRMATQKAEGVQEPYSLAGRLMSFRSRLDHIKASLQQMKQGNAPSPERQLASTSGRASVRSSAYGKKINEKLTVDPGDDGMVYDRDPSGRYTGVPLTRQAYQRVYGQAPRQPLYKTGATQLLHTPDNGRTFNLKNVS